MAIADYYAAADHEAASKFLGQDRLTAKYSAGTRIGGWCPEPTTAVDFFWLIRFNGLAGASPAREVDEEACVFYYPGLVARLGANEIVAQKRDRAGRSVCADRAHGRRKTGLFDEVRDLAGAATAAAGRDCAAATSAGAGGAAERNLRLVL